MSENLHANPFDVEDGGGDLIGLKKDGRLKSFSVAEGYLEDSI